MSDLAFADVRYRIERLSTEINLNHCAQMRTPAIPEKARLVEACSELESERRRYLKMQERFIPD